MAKKIKASTVKLTEIDGSSPSKKSIYELAGLSDSPYRGHKTQEDYEAFLRNLTLTDLQNHAIDVGLVPIDNRDILLGRLVNTFLKSRGIEEVRRGVSANSSSPRPDQKKKIEELLKAGK